MPRHAIKPKAYEKLLAHLVQVEDNCSQWLHDQFPLLTPQREQTVRLLDCYVKQLQSFLADAMSCDCASNELPFVVMGSRVRVVNSVSGKIQEFEILPFYEERVNNNHISILSPLGNALLLKAKGSQVTIKAPRGDINCQVLAIFCPDDTSSGE
jgi:hypothetical protein